MRPVIHMAVVKESCSKTHTFAGDPSFAVDSISSNCQTLEVINEFNSFNCQATRAINESSSSN